MSICKTIKHRVDGIEGCEYIDIDCDIVAHEGLGTKDDWDVSVFIKGEEGGDMILVDGSQLDQFVEMMIAIRNSVREQRSLWDGRKGRA